MSSQIFKQKFPNELLFTLLDKIAIKTDKRYIINKASYKKAILASDIDAFLNECKSYYFLSKHKYLQQNNHYNSFTTVLRQICNFNKITYTSQIKYDKSKYEIEYYIYLA